MEYYIKKKQKLDKLLESWEATYKKGQLTLWIFLALKDSKKYVDEIKAFVETKSQGNMTCEGQSLYRALRKYEHIGVLQYEKGEGNKGPERKYYYMTELGQQLFDQFVQRNIYLFYSKDIKELLNY
ncbi:MAG: PadR family transcriptional regulator [Aestuariibaculum sp.]